MPVVTIYTPCCRAPQARGGNFRRPCNVHVLVLPDEPMPAGWTIRSPRILKRIDIAHNVDSRYRGPKSEFGRAMARAAAEAEALIAPEVAS